MLGAAPHKGNLVARYRGTGAAGRSCSCAHLDVVEARREDWSFDPFTLLEKDGYFYGRGTGDDKAQAAIWVANLIRYKREGFRPSRDLIVALTADEEGGGPYNGVDWLLANRRDLIDAEYCLNEGGWGEMRGGKRLLNLVQVGEKHSATYRLEVRNPGGHSSMPVKENAIYRLAAALGRLSSARVPVPPERSDAELPGEARGPGGGAARVAAPRGGGRRSRGATRRRRGVGPVERGHAHDLCRHRPRRRARGERAPPDRGRARQLPHPPRRDARGGAGGAAQARGDDEKVMVSVQRANGASPMSPMRDDVFAATRAAHLLLLAGGGHGAVHGDGRDGRPHAASGRHPDLRRAGHLLRRRPTSASTGGTSAWACASSTRRRSSSTGS